MKKLRVMPEDGIINNCDLHGLNLPLKKGLEDALGITGIGHNSPWQLLYVSNLLLDHLVEIYGNDKRADNEQPQISDRGDSAWRLVLLRLL
jgi:hypothetical protein